MAETFAAVARFTGTLPMAGASTVRPRLVEWLRAPDVPVMVTVDVDFIAAAPTVKVTAPPDPKLAVTPGGSPDAPRATFPLNPFTEVIRTMPAPVVPWRTLRVPGSAASE